MLDEHQDIQSLAQHGVRVQEVDREDPGSLSVQELPPGRARAARRWIDARSMQDLPDSGRGDRHAELGQFAVDAAVSPQWILFRQADDEAGDARSCRRAAGRAPLARVVFARDQPAMPAQQRRWHNREDGGPAPAGYEPCQHGEPQPVPARTGPAAWRRSTAFSWRSTSSSASFARSLRDIRTARPSIRRTRACLKRDGWGVGYEMVSVRGLVL